MKFLKKSNYGIKEGYRIRSQNEDYFDGTSFDQNVIYQPDVYKLAKYLADTLNAEYIIDIGAGNGEKIKKYLKGYKVIAIDCEVNLKELKENLPGQEIIEYDLEKGLPRISNKILKRSVVISSDVIEHIVDLTGYLNGLAKYSKYAPFMLISTPDRDRVRGIDDFGPPVNTAHVREWTAGELHALLISYGVANVRTGYTINSNQHKDKTTILTIAGTDNIVPTRATSVNPKTLAVMTTFNEEDIIEYAIKNLLNEGVDVHVVDNWSTDETKAKVKKLAKAYKGRLKYELFPKKSSSVYDWEALLNRVDEIASQSQYDWIIHHDSDEIRKSPHPGITIAQAIAYIDKLGYNAIDHTVIDFRPTKDGYNGQIPPEDFFTHFEYGKRPGHFLQVKGWKNYGNKVGLAKSGGHSINLGSLKVYPIKFLIKHYPLRSDTQAKQKIFKDRKPRVKKEERDKGWHVQYDKYTQDSNFLWSDIELTKFHKTMYWQEFIVEQASGVGIIEDE